MSVEVTMLIKTFHIFVALNAIDIEILELNGGNCLRIVLVYVQIMLYLVNPSRGAFVLDKFYGWRVLTRPPLFHSIARLNWAKGNRDYLVLLPIQPYLCSKK